MSNIVSVKLIDNGKLPVYSSDLAAGCDFYALESGSVKADEIVGLRKSIKFKDGTTLPFGILDKGTIEELQNSGLVEDNLINEECTFNDPNVFKLIVKKHPIIVRTGVLMAIPADMELELRGRSGLGFKHELAPHNGTIDADYRGEIKIKIYNHGNNDYHFEAGERICQGVIKQIIQAQFEVVNELPETKRGTGGLGSSGKK
jgi:dUTP pyrophosphatase